MSIGDVGYNRCYILHGDGDTSAATAVQARLREHGLGSYFNWDPVPPHWRFFYETDLTEAEIDRILGPLRRRFHITIES